KPGTPAFPAASTAPCGGVRPALTADRPPEKHNPAARRVASSDNPEQSSARRQPTSAAPGTAHPPHSYRGNATSAPPAGPRAAYIAAGWRALTSHPAPAPVAFPDASGGMS